MVVTISEREMIEPAVKSEGDDTVARRQPAERLKVTLRPEETGPTLRELTIVQFHSPPELKSL
jgi:hypothetical protein